MHYRWALYELEHDAVTVPQNPTNTYVFDIGRIVKQSLTKKSRIDLGRDMMAMCRLAGWQSTTLNPEMAPADKLAIVTAAFGKLATEDTEADLYGELIRLSATTMGWAQGIERRASRDRKRAQRAKKKARKRARKEAKREAEAAKKVGRETESAT